MSRPEDISEALWAKAIKVTNEFQYDEALQNHASTKELGLAAWNDVEVVARAILAAVEAENEACALEALRWEDGIDAAEHIRRRQRKSP